MSLLEQAYEPLTIINRLTVNDGYGGTETVWDDGATINGALVFNNSNLAKIAQSLGSMASYTLTVKKDIDLDFHEVFRRESDGKIFRITSNSDDNKTPKSAGLNMRQYDVEEFTIPKGGLT